MFVFQDTVDPATGDLVSASREVLVGNLQGALVLGAVVAGLVVLGTVLFARRDLQ